MKCMVPDPRPGTGSAMTSPSGGSSRFSPRSNSCQRRPPPARTILTGARAVNPTRIRIVRATANCTMTRWAQKLTDLGLHMRPIGGRSAFE